MRFFIHLASALFFFSAPAMADMSDLYGSVVKGTTGSIGQLYSRMQDRQSRISSLQSQLSNVPLNSTSAITLQSQIAGYQTEVAGLKTQMAAYGASVPKNTATYKAIKSGDSGKTMVFDPSSTTAASSTAPGTTSSTTTPSASTSPDAAATNAAFVATYQATQAAQSKLMSAMADARSNSADLYLAQVKIGGQQELADLTAQYASMIARVSPPTYKKEASKPQLDKVGHNVTGQARAPIPQGLADRLPGSVASRQGEGPVTSFSHFSISSAFGGSDSQAETIDLNKVHLLKKP